MDQLVRRGISHLLKKVPTQRPTSLTKYQQLYYDGLRGSEITDERIISLLKDDGEILDDDDLWLAVIYRRKVLLKKYVSVDEKNRKRFDQMIEDCDAFDYMKIEEAISLMQRRSDNEKQYFEYVKEYYVAIVNNTIKTHPIYFFSLDSDQLKFIRTKLEIDVAEYELTPVAYEIYKSKDFSILGVHPSLKNNKRFVYHKLLEMGSNIEEYYNRLRKQTEMFLNSMNFKLINSHVEDGTELVDYPWFEMTFEAIKDDFVKVSLLENAKPFKTVYTMELHYNAYENEGKKYIQIRNYPVVPSDGEKDRYTENFLKYFNLQ